MRNEEKAKAELSFYFEESEALSGERSNYIDMSEVIAFGQSIDTSGTYEHHFTDFDLKAIAKLRKIRAKICKCTKLTQHTLAQYFACPAKLIADAGFLDRFEKQHDERFSEVAKEYSKNKDLIGLLKLADVYKTPPARLLRLALAEYTQVRP